jgi:hypothetical protein
MSREAGSTDRAIHPLLRFARHEPSAGIPLPLIPVGEGGQDHEWTLGSFHNAWSRGASAEASFRAQIETSDNIPGIPIADFCGNPFR